MADSSSFVPESTFAENGGEGDERYVSVERTGWEGGDRSAGRDVLVREEPLELRIGPATVAVLMRTPGDDEELARGFLVSERVVERNEQVVSIRHCDRVEDPDAEDNVVRITLDPRVPLDLGRLRRNLYSSSSCGICGRASVDDLLEGLEALDLDAGPCVDPSSLYALPTRLRHAQDIFDLTGGLHAAGLFDCEGARLVVREDIGRHNAVDKVLGWRLEHDRGRRGAVLMVSGRVSFEIVQKAFAGRIPIIAAVSAPSSLAVDLAKRAGITLVAFLRGERMGVYANETRLVPASHGGGSTP